MNLVLAESQKVHWKHFWTFPPSLQLNIYIIFNYREIGSDTDEEEAEETPEESSEEEAEEVVKPTKKREKPKPKRFMNKKAVSSDSENEPLQSKRSKQQAEFFFSKKERRESSRRNGKSRGQSNEGMSSSHVFTNFESTEFFHDFWIKGLKCIVFENEQLCWHFFVFWKLLSCWKTKTK